jgi:hypothetical protein
MKLEIHDLWLPQPSICLLHDDNTCEVIAEFEDTDKAREMATLLDYFLASLTIPIVTQE